MREGHRFTNPVDDTQALWNTADLRYIPVQPVTLDVLHRVEHPAIREASDIVDRHDAGVLELGKDARFLFSGGDIENFKRHASVELFVQCQPHYTHSAV